MLTDVHIVDFSDHTYIIIYTYYKLTATRLQVVMNL